MAAPAALTAQAPSPGSAQGPASAPAPVSPASEAAPAPVPGARSAGGVFESDASGQLIVDERMRLAVEAMAGLNPADALPDLISAEVQGLPAPAAAQARELAQRLDAYQTAARVMFPPGQAPLVPQEGLAELDNLVSLRNSYFGAEAARRMFGADEAVTRRLLQLMAADTASTLSMEDKAMRAQARYDQERASAPPAR